MAIIFVSSKERRRALIARLGVVVLGIFFLGFLAIEAERLLSIPMYTPPPAPSNTAINLGVTESTKFKNLQLVVADNQLEFTYVAKNKQGQQVTGSLLAANQDEASKTLKNLGL